MRPLIPSFWLGMQQPPPNFNNGDTNPLGRLWLPRPQMTKSAGQGA